MKLKTLAWAVSLFTLYTSCALHKLQRPTIVTDLGSDAPVKKNSIHLEQGKICYIYSARYANSGLAPALFDTVSKASFFPGNSWSTEGTFFGAAFTNLGVDTVLHSDMLSTVALQEALSNCPLGFQYRYVAQPEFTDSAGKLDPSMVREDFDPDIIINLKSLTLDLSGDAHRTATPVESKPRIVNYCCYATISPVFNHYGDILMDYTAMWEIRNVRKGTIRRIRQTGRFVSPYYRDYSMTGELIACARRVGQEFSSVINNSYHH